LRYQLNPHFLFNALNAASTLVLEGDAPAATRMLAQIGELLRTTLDHDALLETPLSQELVFIEQGSARGFELRGSFRQILSTLLYR
jgi:two-component system LytT family sensor kinase